MIESDFANKGFSKIVFSISGNEVYEKLKNESGVHCVQRFSGDGRNKKMHTSTAGVVVLQEIQEREFNINKRDLRIDTFRSGGKGGQNANKLETAIRIIHLPTGLTVQCQNERQQEQNKNQALTVLRSRLYAIQHNKFVGDINQERNNQLQNLDRSDKVRTYNFPQNRVTDHKTHKAYNDLENIMNGKLKYFIV